MQLLATTPANKQNTVFSNFLNFLEKNGGGSHKSTWKRLFGRKKKDKHRRNSEELKSEEVDSGQCTPTSETVRCDLQQATTPVVRAVGISTEHVASRTGSDMGMIAEMPQLQPTDGKIQMNNGISVDGVIFESEDEDEVFGRKSPDSMEEFSFQFERKDPSVRPINSLPPNVISELRQVIIPAEDQTPVVRKILMEQHKEREEPVEGSMQRVEDEVCTCLLPDFASYFKLPR